MLKIKKNSHSLMSEINIIPFTDILLVILIAFMVSTSALILSSIKVKLPKAKLNSPTTKLDRINISITEKSELFVNNTPVNDLNSLEVLLKSMEIERKIVVVNADKRTYYDLVAKVLSIAKSNGAVNIELLIQNQKE